MKQSHILALLILVISAALLAFSSKDLTTFSTFAEATKSQSRVKIAGQLAKADPIVYKPEVDANFFSFYLIDENEDKRQVVIKEPKRMDFERSEQIVVTGKINDKGVFEASEMLLKCPSKYKEEELALRKQAAVVGS